MPHLKLEYSANVIEKNDLSSLFKNLHVLLAEKLLTEIASCTSRAMPCDIYHIADGQTHHAFVHLEIKALSGRTLETLNNTGQHVMETLKNYFSESTEKLNLKISLEIIELQKTYFH
jgi:5-carboxymethyl-2-hydroxymuconate isomerase